MKDMTIKFPDNDFVEFANGGTAVVAGGIVRLPSGAYGKAVSDIAANTTGIVKIRGRFTAPKATGTAVVQGQPIGWDAGNNRIAFNTEGGQLGIAAAAAASGATEVEYDLEPGLSVINRNPTAGEDSANVATWTPLGGATPTSWNVQLFNAAGLQRPATLTISSGVISIAEANLAATDVLRGWAR